MSHRKLYPILMMTLLGVVAAFAEPPAEDTERLAPASYVLGPGDQISVHVIDFDEIGPQPIRIDMRGNINLPLAGRVPVAGLTVEQLEDELAKRLKSYLKNPSVTVSISDFRSQPISILGAVNKPGIHQLQGHKNLFEVLSLAEGLRNDAGNDIKITRRKEWGPIPLPNAAVDQSGEYSTAKLSIKSIMDAKNPQENIVIKPNDFISVPRAEMIYVVGSVRRPGGFVLNEKETLSVLQAISLAEGLDRTAATQKARILRNTDGAVQRSEIQVDISKILAGKAKDIPLQANDILFVPNNAAKSAALRTVEAVVQAGTGIVVYRRP